MPVTSYRRKRADRQNWLVAPLVEAWWRRYVEDGNVGKEHAIAGTRFRASWAGDCSRAIAYRLGGVEVTDPITVADAWRFNVGTRVHEDVQAAVEQMYPGSTSEVKVQLATDGSGHMDMLVMRPDPETGELIRSAVEIKTVNGTGFRKMVADRDVDPPRFSYVVQGAINAHGMDPRPHELVIAVLSLECISPSEARRHHLFDEYQRFACQYTFTREEYEAIAERELARINRIFELVDTQGPTAVPRVIPDPSVPRHRVVNPAKGLMEIQAPDGSSLGLGHVWQCSYCPFQTQCTEDSDRGQ